MKKPATKVTKKLATPKAPKAPNPDTARASKDIQTLRGPNDLDKIFGWVDAVNEVHNKHSDEINDHNQKFEYLKERLLELEDSTGTRVDALEDLITLVRSEKSLDEVRRNATALDKQIGKMERATEALDERCDALEEFNAALAKLAGST